MEDKASLSFDKEYKLRAFEESKFARADELQKECSGFVEKITSFNEKINALVSILDAHATRIDAQKLKAIGLRLAAENEDEQRSKKQKALQALISERRAEYDRITQQLQSLERIEADQRATLEKMNTA